MFHLPDTNIAMLCYGNMSLIALPPSLNFVPIDDTSMVCFDAVSASKGNEGIHRLYISD